MSFASISRRWEWLARRDPLWAILSDGERTNGRWKLDEFFATGETEVGAVLAYLASRGITVDATGAALDFGCGVGRLTRALANRFAEVDGIDVSPTMIELAHQHNANTPRMRFLLNAAPHLRMLASDHYAFVYSSIVLQHIAYPASLEYVREFMRVARPGGIVVFQIPTEDRTPAPLKLARCAIRSVLQRTPLVPAAHIEMHAVPASQIIAAGRTMDCELLDQVRTSSARAGTNGKLEYYRDDRNERIVSTQFTFRRLGTV
ncbi:MAG: class I SAM-dependent methyltransferase [Kofleriaceae bacterium]